MTILLTILMVCAYIVYAQLKKSFSPSRRKKFYRNLLFPKGSSGEKRVSAMLQELPRNQYTVFNNVILETKGGSTQIDHIVVSVFGIFVIETKNYSGSIYGGEDSEYWTQNIHGHTYKLYNPILQNEGHIRAIKQLLSKYGKLPIMSIIAFSNNANLHVKSTSADIVCWSKLKYNIRKHDNAPIPADNVKAICDCIRAASNNTKTNSRQHVRNVRATVKKKQTTVASGRCPRCGGKLILRSGRYGKFWGCSKFPKCKYTHDAKGF